MRNTDEKKWNDSWFRRLGANEKLLYLYLSDNCDCGGFLDYDLEMWAFEIGLGSGELEEAWLKLVESRKVQHWVKGGSSEGLVWVKNASKIQLNYKEIDTRNHFHRGIYKRLAMHLGKFPEIQEKYLSQARVNGDPTLTLGRVTGKGKGIGKGKGESEGEIEGSDHPEYAKMIEHGLHRSCKYLNFRQLQRMHPELDWEQLVDHLVMTHENEINGVGNAYSFLAACGRKGMFSKGAVNGKPKKVSAKQKKRDAIERAYQAGEISDEECAKQIAELGA